MSPRVVFPPRSLPLFGYGCGLLLLFVACGDAPPGGGSGQAGSDGTADAGCPQGPQPTFTVTITAVDGPVPPDTSLSVTWSAGPEPTFQLNAPSTWKTLEQGTNVVCDVNLQAPPPKDLPELVCQLWTSGPTKVVIKAKSYQDYTETLIPDISDVCESPIPQAVAIQLLPDLDAGTTP